MLNDCSYIRGVTITIIKIFSSLCLMFKKDEEIKNKKKEGRLMERKVRKKETKLDRVDDTEKEVLNVT